MTARDSYRRPVSSREAIDECGGSRGLSSTAGGRDVHRAAREAVRDVPPCGRCRLRARAQPGPPDPRLRAAPRRGRVDICPTSAGGPSAVNEIERHEAPDSKILVELHLARQTHDKLPSPSPPVRQHLGGVRRSSLTSGKVRECWRMSQLGHPSSRWPSRLKGTGRLPIHGFRSFDAPGGGRRLSLHSAEWRRFPADRGGAPAARVQGRPPALGHPAWTNGRELQRKLQPLDAIAQVSATAGTPSRSRDGSSAPARAASSESPAATPIAATKPSVKSAGEA